MEIIEERPELESRMIRLDVQRCLYNAEDDAVVVKKSRNLRIQRNENFKRRGRYAFCCTKKNN